MAGEEPPAFSEPKLIFGLLDGPVALPFIVTEDGFRLCSDVPFTALLFTIVGPPTVGTAGVMLFLPFTGEIELLLP